MNLVLSGPIDDSLTNAVFNAVKPSGVVRINSRALRFEDTSASFESAAIVSSLCKKNRVDHSYVEQAVSLSSFGLLVIDMDSTLITIECIDEIADFAGKRKEVAAITEATMTGAFPDFYLSLQQRVALLAGLETDTLRRVFEERLKLTRGARELIFIAQSAGLYTMLISGGFTYFTERIAKLLSFDANHANTLEIVNNRLTGRLSAPIIGAKEKAEIVERTLISLGLTPSQGLVIGDGSNDIPMMKLVDHSVAYHGKQVVVQAAKHSIAFGSLEVVTDYFSS